MGFAIQVAAAGAALMWPTAPALGYGLFALGSVVLVGSLGWYFLSNYRLRVPWAQRGDRRGPESPIPPPPTEPPGKLRTYLPAEKKRLGELVASISERLNNDGLRIVRAPWLRSVHISPDNAWIATLANNVAATCAAVSELIEEVWTRTLTQNPKYERELVAIVGGLDGTHPLSNFRGQVENYRREIERFQATQIPHGEIRDWLVDYVFRREPQDVIRPSAEKVESWIGQCNAKIAQEREILK